MSVTPNEIRNREFSVALRGYSKSEVESFRDMIAREVEDVRAELSKQQLRYQQLEERHSVLAQLENTLKSAIFESQKTAEGIISKAQEEAKRIAFVSERARDERLTAATEEFRAISDKSKALDSAYHSYVASLRSVIVGHLATLDDLAHKANPTPAVDELRASEELSATDFSGDHKSETLHKEVSIDSPQSLPSVAFLANSELKTESSAITVNDGAGKIARAASDALRRTPTTLAGDLRTTDDEQEHSLASSLLAQTPQPVVSDAVESIGREGATRNIADGIVVFGRREDREKTFEDNARILKDLDTVVDKFAAELAERERR